MNSYAEPGIAPSPRKLKLASLLLGLTCWVRPDGVLFTAGALLALLVARGLSRDSIRIGLVLSLGPIVLSALLLAFRLIYYGTWVPNTFYAKSGTSWQRAKDGIAYVEDSLQPLGALWAVLALGFLVALFARDARRRLAFPLASALLWSLYVVRIGGDICPQRRHLVITFALSALVLFELLDFAAQRRAPTARYATAMLAPTVLAWLMVGQLTDSARQRALSDTWHWSGRAIGTMLRRSFAHQRPLLAVDAAGALPYYYRLPCLDMLGLNDRHIATHPPPGIGAGYVGHELGDGKYVLSRKPDLVAFWTPNGNEQPKWRSGIELVRLGEWRTHYRRVVFETPDASRARSKIYVRIRNGRIGIEHRSDSVVAPAYALRGEPESVVRQESQGKLYVELAKDQFLFAGRELELQPGSWRVHVEAEGDVKIEVIESDERLELKPGASFDVGLSDHPTLVLSAAASTARVHRVVLARDAQLERAL